MKKTLLAAAVLAASSAAIAEPASPATVVYAPYGLAPVAVDARQAQAIAEAYGRQVTAALEAQRKANAAAVEDQRRSNEAFERFHADNLRQATAGQTDGEFERMRAVADAMRDDMARMGDEVQARVVAGDRKALDEYFDARVKEVADRYATRQQEFDAARKVMDARIEEALKARVVTPVAPFNPVPAYPL